MKSALAIVVCTVLLAASAGGTAPVHRHTFEHCEQFGKMISEIAEIRDKGVSEDDAVAQIRQDLPDYLERLETSPEVTRKVFEDSLRKIVEEVYSRRGISPESLRDEIVNECKENVSTSE